MSDLFGKGIFVTSGFDLVGAPVDHKYIADTYEDMVGLFQTGGYEGMQVYCKADSTVYILKGDSVDDLEPLVNINFDGDISAALVNYPTKTEVANTYAKKSTTLSGYGITDAYTKTEVDSKVSALVDSAPETLNTLNELAAALGDNANFAATVAEQIGLKANTADLAKVATSGNYSDLSGTPTSLPANGGTATKATQDGSGNVITSTYAKVADTYTKAQVDAKIADAVTGGQVDLSGYLTTTEASSTYAKKTELATALTTAEIDEILAQEVHYGDKVR